MALVKKTVNITDRQDAWIRSQIDEGLYGNDSEVIRALIREKLVAEQESEAEIAAIRAAIIEGEESGISDRSVAEIFEEAHQAWLSRRG